MEEKPKYKATVADCLQYLDMAGWSELIDTRWRRQVEKDLRLEFGDALSEETLEKAVNCILCKYLHNLSYVKSCVM